MTQKITQNTTQNIPDIPQNIIEVSGLSKSYKNVPALNDINFKVKSGDFFSLLGQNGAGKSTAINILVGLLSKDAGTILYNGSGDYKTFKNDIGVVFQENIFDDFLTVEENLLLYGILYCKDKNYIRTRLNEILKMLSLNEVAKKQIRHLSGGQKRKCEIARALWNNPKILFLDEPTTGLDPRTRQQIWEIIHKIRKQNGMTVFLTTHYMEETADCNEVIIIHKGEIVADGTPSELKSRYSSDKLFITPNDDKAFEKKLKVQKIAFEKTADTYCIKVTDTKYTLDLLNKFRADIKFFEVKKGNMDDVFLNAVGEQIQNEWENEKNTKGGKI
jgi:multidrug/hemolysin transport system ATP-binding protein